MFHRRGTFLEILHVYDYSLDSLLIYILFHSNLVKKKFQNRCRFNWFITKEAEPEAEKFEEKKFMEMLEIFKEKMRNL